MLICVTLGHLCHIDPLLVLKVIFEYIMIQLIFKTISFFFIESKTICLEEHFEEPCNCKVSILAMFITFNWKSSQIHLK